MLDARQLAAFGQYACLIGREIGDLRGQGFWRRLRIGHGSAESSARCQVPGGRGQSYHGALEPRKMGLFE